jgi:hypothetical protein
MLVPAILNAGYNFDFIDDRAIGVAGIPYSIVVLPNVERIPFATLQRLQQYVAAGGHLIATRSLPSLGTGLLEAKSETESIRSLARQLFVDKARFVAEIADLPAALNQFVPPDLASGNAAPATGFVHRKLSGIDIYFVANSSNQPVHTKASFRIKQDEAESWNPFTGEAVPVVSHPEGDRTELTLDLAPYESRVFVFSNTPIRASVPQPRSASPGEIDLSSDWKVTFRRLNLTLDYPKLRSWTDDERTRFYSGEAAYQKTVEVPIIFLSGASGLALDFGPGTPVEPAAGQLLGMRALLESPVHESAVVYVNGERAGAVWHPPFTVDVARFLKKGSNQLTIVVGNTAMNGMAARALPDYRLLNFRYGERFTPQDVKDIRPLPSGITGSVKLIKW